MGCHRPQQAGVFPAGMFLPLFPRVSVTGWEEPLEAFTLPSFPSLEASFIWVLEQVGVGSS